MDFFYRLHTILVMFLSIFQKREIIAHTYSWHHKNKTLYYIPYSLDIYELLNSTSSWIVLFQKLEIVK